MALVRIVHIAAEMAPIAKVGGLGDVVGGLSSVLSKQKGIDISVILPKYKSLKTQYLKDLKIIKKNFKIFERSRWQVVNIYLAKVNGVQVYLIEDKKNYFSKKPKIYGYKYDVHRFLFFCKAVLEFLKADFRKIDIIHIHDWHTAVIAPLYKDIYSKNLKHKAKIVLSIHNLQYQGLCKPKDIKNLGFNGKYYLTKEKLKDPNRPKTLNLLKGGLVYSDIIIPVSENYAKEIMTKELGCNLEKITQKYKKKIKGVLNGIDQNFWRPEKDKDIKYKYSSKSSLKKFIDAKNNNKKELQKILNLDEDDKPLICSIGRLVSQKGPDLIKAAILESIKVGAQFVLLGSALDKKITNSFKKLQKDLKKNKNVSLNFEHNEKLSHKFFSAADFIIIPSLFEPCGLTQIIGFKYGVMPIVRETGGLADTVFDLDDKTISKEKRNGFTFTKFLISSQTSTLKRAINFFKKDQNEFYEIVHKNMKLDFSWEKTAKKYLTIYKKVL